MGTKSEEEIEREYVEKMPNNLGRKFFELYKDLVWLHSQWNDYIYLFTNESPLNTLNKSAPAFARNLQKLLLQDIILRITRLTDSKKGKGKSNQPRLVMRSFLDEIPEKDLKLKNQTIILIKQIEKNKNGFAKDLRNHFIAHKSLLSLTDSEPVLPLEPFSIQKVKDCLEAFDEVFNLITTYYGLNEVAYSAMLPSGNGILGLIYHLKLGLSKDEPHVNMS